MRLRHKNKKVAPFYAQYSSPSALSLKDALLKKNTHQSNRSTHTTLSLAVTEPDDHLPNNLINLVLNESGELLKCRQIIKGQDSDLWKPSLANDV